MYKKFKSGDQQTVQCSFIYLFIFIT